MKKTVQVIINKCFWNYGWRIDGDRLFDEVFSTFAEAWVVGTKQVAEKMNVIVRPNYNEHDERGTYFREWRSFNGENFKEVRFDTNL